MNVDFGADYEENEARLHQIDDELKELGRRMDTLHQEHHERAGVRKYLQAKAQQIMQAQAAQEAAQQSEPPTDGQPEEQQEPDGLRIVSE